MQKPVTNWDQVPIQMDLPMAARILGRRSVEYLQQQCKKGQFPGYKDGRTWLVDKEDLRQYIEARKATQKEAALCRRE